MSDTPEVSLPEFIRMHWGRKEKAKRTVVTNSTKKKDHNHITISKMGNNPNLARLMSRDKPGKKTGKKTVYRVSGVSIVI